MSEGSTHRIGKTEHALLRQAWTSEGRSDAFAFAANCHANIGAIETEIQEREALIAELLANHPKDGPMSPGSSPRIYRDAYLAGLREAIALIQTMGADS